MPARAAPATHFQAERRAPAGRPASNGVHKASMKKKCTPGENRAAQSMAGTEQGTGGQGHLVSLSTARTMASAHPLHLHGCQLALAARHCGPPTVCILQDARASVQRARARPQRLRHSLLRSSGLTLRAGLGSAQAQDALPYVTLTAKQCPGCLSPALWRPPAVRPRPRATARQLTWRRPPHTSCAAGACTRPRWPTAWPRAR